MSLSPWPTAQADVETGNPRSGAGEGENGNSWERWEAMSVFGFRTLWHSGISGYQNDQNVCDKGGGF